MTKTPSTTKIKLGDVVLVEVTFTNGVGSKLRPALVISSDTYNKNRDEVIIAAITSNTQKLHEGDTLLEEWAKAGLKVPSLLTAIIQTVKKDRIKKRLGQIQGDDRKRAAETLANILSFEM